MPELGEWVRVLGTGEEWMLIAPDAGIEARIRQLHPRVGGTVTVGQDDPWEWGLVVGRSVGTSVLRDGYVYANGVLPTREEARAAAVAALAVLVGEMNAALERAAEKAK
jgi:hypothetical protein